MSMLDNELGKFCASCGELFDPEESGCPCFCARCEQALKKVK